MLISTYMLYMLMLLCFFLLFSEQLYQGERDSEMLGDA